MSRKHNPGVALVALILMILLVLVVCTGCDEALRTLFDDRGICSPSAHIETVRYTFALVEFTDGAVKKVDPERVRFMDKEAGR